MHLSQAIDQIEIRAARLSLQDEYGEELLPCEKIWHVARHFSQEADKIWDLLERGELCAELYAKIWVRFIGEFERQQFAINLETELKKIFS